MHTLTNKSSSFSSPSDIHTRHKTLARTDHKDTDGVMQLQPNAQPYRPNEYTAACESSVTLVHCPLSST